MDDNQKQRKANIFAKDSLFLTDKAYYAYNCYCGCGEESSAGEKMVLCENCRKWFHCRCTEKAKNFPLLKGDPDYVFHCKPCGSEENLNLCSTDLAKNLKTVLRLAIYNLQKSDDKSETYFPVQKITASVFKNFAIFLSRFGDQNFAKQCIQTCLEDGNSFLAKTFPTQKNTETRYSICYLHVKTVRKGLSLKIERLHADFYNFSTWGRPAKKQSRASKRNAVITKLTSKNSALVHRLANNRLSPSCLGSLGAEDKERLLRFLPEIDRGLEPLSAVFGCPFFQRDLAMYAAMLAQGDFDQDLRADREAASSKRTKGEGEGRFWTDRVVDELRID